MTITELQTTTFGHIELLSAAENPKNFQEFWNPDQLVPTKKIVHYDVKSIVLAKKKQYIVAYFQGEQEKKGPLSDMTSNTIGYDFSCIFRRRKPKLTKREIVVNKANLTWHTDLPVNVTSTPGWRERISRHLDPAPVLCTILLQRPLVAPSAGMVQVRVVGDVLRVLSLILFRVLQFWCT